VKIPIKKAASQLLDFILPLPLRKLRDSFEPKPVINYGACARCGDCLRICASKAISSNLEGNERKMVIDYNGCIRCFCCHEICPMKAIDIRN
jgi:ferredoxin